MRPDEVGKALQETTKALRGKPSTEVVDKAAREVATIVRSAAARSGHNIGIRLLSRPNGVRVTLVGRDAGRYRRMVEDELRRRIPDVAADIRAQITRRTK